MQIKMLLGAAAMLAVGIVQAQAGEVMSRYGTVTAVPMAAGTVVVRVKSVHGWSCEGLYARPDQPDAAVNFPLSCSDDVEGKALMSIENGRAALMFQRKDGSKGSAAITVY